MTVRLIGDVAPGLSHESGAVSVEQYEVRTLVYRGMRAELEAMLPAQGAEWGEGSGLFVRSARLEPGAGGTGTLTLTLAGGDAAGAAAFGQGSVTHEVEWSRLEKPIQANPKMMAGYSGADRQKAFDELEAWRASPQQRRRRYQIPLQSLTREADADTDADWTDMTAKAYDLAKKIAQGVESYIVFTPVLTRTSVTASQPATGGCGMIYADPPGKIAGYVYLKVADSAVQQADGLWRRVEQWQGADAWDEDLYPQGAG